MGYTLDWRGTQAEWDAVERENPLARKMAMAQSAVERVLRGVDRVCYLTGGAGVGKDHAIRRAIEETNAKAVPFTVSDDYELLRAFEATGKDTSLILNEAEHVFRDKRCLNLLKLATDTAYVHETTVTDKPKKAGDPPITRKVSLCRRMVFATNADLTDDKQWPAWAKPHIHALLDRKPPILIDADPEAWWEYTVWLALRKGLIRTNEDKSRTITLKNQNKAIQWFTDTARRQSSLSPRRLVQIASVFMDDLLAQQEKGAKYDPQPLQDALEQFLLSTPRAMAQPPYPPAIFYTPLHLRATPPQAAQPAQPPVAAPGLCGS